MSKGLKLALCCLLMAGATVVGTVQQNWSALKNPQAADENIPTIFVHGMPSNYHSEVKMVNALLDAGITTPDNVVLATVSPQGAVTFDHALPAHPHNPIIEVNLENNHEQDNHISAMWLRKVVVDLQQQYHFQKVNFVGHSSGPLLILCYIMDNANDKHLPQVNRLVSLGGAFNGALGKHDRPNAMELSEKGLPVTRQTKEFRELVPLHEMFPRHIRVLNVYGDLCDGSNSDGRVANNSSRAMRYLVAERARSYQEARVTGANADHSGLHNNKKVDFYLIRFLYGENC
ncbi:MAG: alpha/beta hydrolase [Limosilactobacillus sp.]